MYACIHVCMHACVHVCMYVCMHVCAYVRYVSMYACMHVCICVCMHACMYMCVYQQKIKLANIPPGRLVICLSGALDAPTGMHLQAPKELEHGFGTVYAGAPSFYGSGLEESHKN